MIPELDAIKARAAIVAAKDERCEATREQQRALVTGAVEDVPRVVAAIEAVLAVHERIDHKREDGTIYWSTCPQCFTEYCGDAAEVEYPCPTVTAIHRALEEGKQ